MQELTDVSLITGRLRYTAHEDDNTPTHIDAVVRRNEQLTVADNSARMFNVVCLTFSHVILN